MIRKKPSDRVLQHPGHEPPKGYRSGKDGYRRLVERSESSRIEPPPFLGGERTPGPDMSSCQMAMMITACGTTAMPSMTAHCLEPVRRVLVAGPRLGG
ncbi:unnamed protein product [Protopolystoma xenopodis]|uniref:Uncharacterized protein n=1 Tax=Protopolystoma xenopodis TaxID=117903 RepID=A0A3S5CQM1_9PLAT|nr:unnamed protein product [Protopolystoma xenopodis]